MNSFCSIPNHTYAISNVNDERITKIKSNQIIGFFGSKIDDILIRKNRKCKLIGELNLGERLDNGTWTGNLGLIQRGEAILYLKSERNYFYYYELPIINLFLSNSICDHLAILIDTSIEGWMNYLFPFHREKFVIIDDISDDIRKNSQKENMTNVLNCFNFDLTLLFSLIFTTFISFSIIIALKLLSHQNKNRRKRKSIGRRIKNILMKYLNGQWNLDYSKLTNITIFILFYSLYLWFIRLVIANNIKTNKVIVDQSILIKDENDALMTKKTFCLFEGETELSIALSSNSNILSKLYNQKNIVSRAIKGLNIENGKKCIVKRSFDSGDIDTKELFSIISENFVFLILSLFGNLRPDLILWFSSKPIFEMNYHLISKNQKDLIDLFDRILLLHNEAGLTKRLIDSLGLNSYGFLQSHTVYRTIEEFVNGNSKFTDLNVKSFKLLFIIYISVCLIILIINLLHYLLVKTILFYLIKSLLFKIQIY